MSAGKLVVIVWSETEHVRPLCDMLAVTLEVVEHSYLGGSSPNHLQSSPKVFSKSVDPPESSVVCNLTIQLTFHQLFYNISLPDPGRLSLCWIVSFFLQVIKRLMGLIGVFFSR